MSTTIDEAVAAIMGARYQARVGDRVVIRLGECRICHEDKYSSDAASETWLAPGVVQEGLTGLVEALDGDVGSDVWQQGDAHVIGVRVDNPVPRARLHRDGTADAWHGSFYAPTELELVADAAARGGGPGGE